MINKILHKFKTLKLFVVSIILVYGLYTVKYRHKPIYYMPSDLINTTSCHIPYLELNPNGWKFKYESPNCESSQRNWVFISKGKIVYRDEIFKEKNGFDCQQKTSNGFIAIQNNSKIENDVIEVICKSRHGTLFNGSLLGVKPLNNIEPETSKYMSTEESFENKRGFNLNILMFGFDSVSHKMWERKLPKSLNKFKSLGGIVLEKYNILGDGTPQALLPILTGKTEEELPEARRGFPNASYVDGHPWIWKTLKKRGYVTQWGEDSPNFGTFTLRMMGFREKPVDHYMEPFQKKVDPYLCYDQQPSHLVFMNYLREFLSVYDKNQPKFSFLFHSAFSHGSDEFLHNADDDLENLLDELNSTGVLDRSLLILMADHGARYSTFRQTEQGKYEERLPFMSFRLPQTQRFKEMNHRLLLNSQRLTSPFDIHETLIDMLNYHERESIVRKRPYPRAVSLLREIPKDRMCADIGIESHWCSCMHHQPYSVNASEVKDLAKKAVEHINKLIEPHSSFCETLQLDQVNSAIALNTNKNLLAFRESADAHGRVPDLSDEMASELLDVMITIRTLPNNALYEVTLGSRKANVKFISRVNAYGNQPKCIIDQHPYMRLYCYCKNQIS